MRIPSSLRDRRARTPLHVRSRSDGGRRGQRETARGAPRPVLAPARLAALALLACSCALTDEVQEEGGRRRRVLPALIFNDPDGPRARLEAAGVAPYATWFGETVQGLDGGLAEGSTLGGLLEFGVDVDLGEVASLPGWQFHASGIWIQSNDDPSAELVGDFDTVSNIAAEAAVRLYRLYLQRELLDGRLVLKGGQLALDDDFMISRQAALFLNSAFGPLPTQSANSGAPIYPLPALGAWGRLRTSEAASVQFGVYDGDAGTQAGNGGGLETDLGGDDGLMALVEGRLDAEIAGREGTWKLGGHLHTGEFTDFGAARQVSGNSSIYASLDQMLIGTREDFGLGAFLRGGLAPDDRNAVDTYVDAGITVRGLRPEDQVGLAYLRAGFADDFVAANAAAGTPITRAESVFELFYLLRPSAYVLVQPDLQYVIAPQDAAADDALVFLLRVQLSL